VPPLSDDSLLSDGFDIWVLKGGRRFKFPDPPTLAASRYARNAMVTMSPGELAAVPAGPGDGMFLQEEPGPDEPNKPVWQFAHGALHHVLPERPGRPTTADILVVPHRSLEGIRTGQAWNVNAGPWRVRVGDHAKAIREAARAKGLTRAAGSILLVLLGAFVGAVVSQWLNG
jgi:hypothetical protein